MWRRWGTPQNFFLAFINELWKTWKIRILKKWKKKIPGDIVLLHICTKSQNHRRYSSWDTELEFFCHFGPFFPFEPPNNLKNQNFEEIKKKPGDIIILHFCTTNDDHMSNGSWDIKHDREFFVISDYFLPFYPPNNPENQNFEKMKKTPVGIIILNMSNINEIWYLRYEPEIPFTPITVQKLKISKKWKKCRDISSFYTSVPKIMIICYTSWDMASDRCNCYFSSFGLFFALLPS